MQDTLNSVRCIEHGLCVYILRETKKFGFVGLGLGLGNALFVSTGMKSYTFILNLSLSVGPGNVHFLIAVCD